MATTSLNDWTFHKFNIFTHSNGAVEFDVDIQKNQFRWKSNRINSNPTVAMPEIANHKSMTENEKKQALLFVKQKLDAAKWFINAIQQRQQTLILTITSIIKLQKKYFLTGDETRLGCIGLFNNLYNLFSLDFTVL